jgi:hypothetical protein
MLPGSARRYTKSLKAVVWFRRERIFHGCQKIRVFLLGEEPGGEVHRDDRDDQYDTGDKACPDWKMVPPSRRIGLGG